MTDMVTTAPLDTLAETFCPTSLDRLTETELRDRLHLAKQLEGLATVGMARIVHRLSTAGAPRRDGASSLHGWVQQQTGRSTREAARLTRLASGLDALPATAAAVASGQVTPESADVLLCVVDDGRLCDARQVGLCHACHTLVHDDGWHPVLDQPSGDVTWTGPDGRTVTARPRPRRD